MTIPELQRIAKLCPGFEDEFETAQEGKLGAFKYVKRVVSTLLIYLVITNCTIHFCARYHYMIQSKGETVGEDEEIMEHDWETTEDRNVSKGGKRKRTTRLSKGKGEYFMNVKFTALHETNKFPSVLPVAIPINIAINKIHDNDPVYTVRKNLVV